MRVIHVMAMVLGLTAIAPSSAFANKGAFDFLDPCIAVHDEFRDARDEGLRRLNVRLANLDNAKAPDEYRKDWLKQKKVDLRKYFDETIKPAIEAAGGKDFDAAYERFFENVMTALTPEKLAEVQDASFRFEAKRYLQRSSGAALEEGEKEVSESCKMDVGNQALRVALIAVLKPFTFVAGNWKAAEKDGFIAQLIAAPTGINIVDAVRCPIRGCSSESVVNRVLSGRFF